ncbi:hypothetical protein TNCV_1787071 [Trichonephila clavipes]|nr:hypothetical protein TNCV_1787071 [Trichonephila clavipes]
MINGRTRLHVVANGTMTGQRYIDEVLLPHVRLFRGAVGDKFVFMDDNATCHRTLAVQDCLDSECCMKGILEAGGVLDKCVQMWRRNYGALGQTDRDREKKTKEEVETEEKKENEQKKRKELGEDEG